MENKNKRAAAMALCTGALKLIGFLIVGLASILVTARLVRLIDELDKESARIRVEKLPHQEVEIETLIERVLDNTIRAEMDYGNKQLTVRGGIVRRVRVHSNTGKPYVILIKQGDELYGSTDVRCHLREGEAADLIRTGAPLDVRGVFVGDLGQSVQMKDCVLLTE